jgi:hypothetical protein
MEESEVSVVEGLKEVLPYDDPKKKVWLKGQADSPGGMRVMFSIDERLVLTPHELLDLIMSELATLLNFAALDDTIGIEMLHYFHDFNEGLRMKLGGAPEVFNE